MACPSGRFSAELFDAAMSNFELWDAVICPFAGPTSMLLVGTVIYSGIGLNIFLRQDSVIIPFVLALILGGTVVGQTIGVISSFVAMIILIVPPLIISLLIFTVDRRG